MLNEEDKELKLPSVHKLRCLYEQGSMGSASSSYSSEQSRSIADLRTAHQYGGHVNTQWPTQRSQTSNDGFHGYQSRGMQHSSSNSPFLEQYRQQAHNSANTPSHPPQDQLHPAQEAPRSPSYPQPSSSNEPPKQATVRLIANNNSTAQSVHNPDVSTQTNSPKPSIGPKPKLSPKPTLAPKHSTVQLVPMMGNATSPAPSHMISPDVYNDPAYPPMFAYPPQCPPQPSHQGFSNRHEEMFDVAEIGFRPEVIFESPPNRQSVPTTHVQTMDMGKWDEDRDRVYSMVLGAEEYLWQMDDGDERIRLYSEAVEKELHHKTIQELLGIRGHLQDELLRIEAMLAESDPELKCLGQFQTSHPRVVGKLWELRDKKKVVNANQVTGILELPDQAKKVQKVLASYAKKVKNAAALCGETQSDKSTSANLEGQSTTETKDEGGASSSGGIGTPEEMVEEFELEITEEDLEKEHKEEEQHVAEKYAGKIVHQPQQLSKEQLDQLLSDHALSMQALRNRQNQEKEKFRELLEQKKNQRLLHRRAQKQEEEESEIAKDQSSSSSDSSMVVKNDQRQLRTASRGSADSGIDSERGQGDGKHVQKRGEAEATQKEEEVDSDSELSTILSSLSNEGHGKVQGYEDDFEDDASDDGSTGSTADLRNTFEGDLWKKLDRNLSRDEYDKLIRDLREQEEDRKMNKAMEKSRHKEGLAAKLARKKQEEEIKQAELMKKEDELAKRVQDLEKQEAEAEERLKQLLLQNHELEKKNGRLTGEEYEMEMVLKDEDTDFIKKLRKQHKGISDEEFALLLKQHLEDTERLRKQKQSQKDRMQDKLREKLKNKRLNSQLEESENYVGKEESTNEIDMDDDNVNEELDEETQKEVNDMEEKFQRILKHQRHELTDEELQALLEQHRREKAKIIAQKEMAKEGLDEKLKQKLQLRRDKSIKLADKKLSTLDDNFFQNLMAKQKNGELSKEEFADLLKDYMEHTDNVKREEKRKLREKVHRKESQRSIRASVDTLVQQHQADTKTLTDMRQREKSLMDSRLQAKLAAKKKQSPVIDEAGDDR